MRSPLFWKVLFALATLVAAGGALAWLLAAPRVQEDVREQARVLLEGQSALLVDLSGPAFAGREAADQLEARLHRLAATAGVRFTVVREGGEVLADSAREASAMERHGPEDRPEIRGALERGLGHDVRTSATVGEPYMYVARRVDVAGRTVGVVRAAMPLTREAALRRRLLADLALGILLAAVFALGIGAFVARRLTRPLREMTEAAAAIAGGEYDRRVPASLRDELGQLGQAFNQMAAELRDRVQTITRERGELRALLAGMVEGVVAVDAEERVVLLNGEAARILQADAGGAVGRPIWEVTRIREVGEALGEAVRSGAPEVREAHVSRASRDGHLRLHAAPLRDAEGRPAGAVLVLHDISELRRLEMVRRDFVANVSHELKTPLAAVRGFVETILEDEAMDPATQRRFLGRVREQTLRLATMVEELLALSRAESPEADVARAPTDLRDPVRDAAQAVAPRAEAKSQTLTTTLPGEPLVVLGNEEALRRIAANLLDNAVKYTPAGGQVRVRAFREGGQTVLEVEDTGPGIPERDRERVFERFYRVDKGRSRDAGGTGLGLAIVKHLVRALGGSVGVDASPEGGSRFRVRLPSA